MNFYEDKVKTKKQKRKKDWTDLVLLLHEIGVMVWEGRRCPYIKSGKSQSQGIEFLAGDTCWDMSDDNLENYFFLPIQAIL